MSVTDRDPSLSVQGCSKCRTITMDMPNMTEDEKIAFNKILDALRTAYRGVMV